MLLMLNLGRHLSDSQLGKALGGRLNVSIASSRVRVRKGGAVDAEDPLLLTVLV